MKWIKDNIIIASIYVVIGALIIIVIMISLVKKGDDISKDDAPEEEVIESVQRVERADTDLTCNAVCGLDKITSTHPNLSYKFYANIGEEIDGYLKSQGITRATATLRNTSDVGTVINMTFLMDDSNECLYVTYRQSDATFEFTME